MPSDITKRRETSFVLWIPGDQPAASDTPRLVLGKWDSQQNRLQTLVNEPLKPSQDVTGLWVIPCASVNRKIPSEWRQQPWVFIYWFQVKDTSPNEYGLMHVTDPLAYSLDYRAVKQPGDQPAATIWIDLDQDQLLPCDHTATQPAPPPGQPPPPSEMPQNNQIVIYEVPASFVRGSSEGTDPKETDIGTFSDVAGLLDAPPDGTSSEAPLINGQPYLIALGVNALELTPPADAKPPHDDTKSRQEWGYATAHYFAPDYQLGYKNEASTAVRDLSRLVQTCHGNKIRFFADVVMAFGHDPYKHIAFQQFHLIPKNELDNDDSYQSSRPRNRQNLRDGWGGESWRYIMSTKTYDPESGRDMENVCPAASFHLAHIHRWISYYQIDGIRLDSIENVANWNFLRRVRDKAHEFFGTLRYPNDEDEDGKKRLTVVGEELSVPKDLISSGTLDGYWNEEFKKRLRTAILGYTYGGDDFDWTVRKIVDCRLLDRGFERGVQAINYITSHDTGGEIINQRLWNYLEEKGVYDKQGRTNLAFAVLLTSIGTPMIFAGEEFCDKQDRAAEHPGKQVDPVNWGRLRRDEWRMEVVECVGRLVGLRKRSEELREDEVKFVHWDFEGGRKIMAWVRGGEGELPVVVVANFSGVGPEGSEYVVSGWPKVERDGRKVRWREVSQGREVPDEWVGREPVFGWEAKVYECYIDGQGD